MLKLSLKFTVLFSLVFIINLQAQQPIQFADPTIFLHNKTYYLYGTVEDSWNSGFKAYTSKDGKSWTDKGIVLNRGDVYGTKGFWAPQVFEYKNKFYMAYVANENIAIAESNSPLGPFTQKNKQAIDAPVRMIDPYIFFDKGKIFLYHVRLDKGNRIYVAEMTEDLSSIKEETVKECIHATDLWEDTQKVNWTVTEGPTVIKHGDKYYLFYSANDFRNPDYAVGYATSDNPIGPWKKYEHNPILSKLQTKVNGSGHGDFFIDKQHKLQYVFHTHESNTKVGHRKTALITTKFSENGELKTDSSTFRYLYK